MFKEQQLVVLQLEIPLKTTAKAIELANQYLVPVMLTPAPAQKLPEQILTGVALKIIGETGVKTAEKIVNGESVDETIPVNLKVIAKE